MQKHFLHYDLNFGPDDAVEVELDKQANVRLLDDANFALYKSGSRHRYYGGLAERSPLQLKPPRAGRWHLVIDLGGYAGQVVASARLLKHAAQAV